MKDSLIRQFLMRATHTAKCAHNSYAPTVQPCDCGFDQAFTDLAVMEMKVDSAIAYEFLPQTFTTDGRAIGEITINRHVYLDGSIKWAVYLRGAMVLDEDGDWVLESIPSSRTDDHIARTRFDFEEVWSRAHVAAAKEKENASR
jgi:hypothetical protein